MSAIGTIPSVSLPRRGALRRRTFTAGATLIVLLFVVFAAVPSLQAGTVSASASPVTPFGGSIAVKVAHQGVMYREAQTPPSGYKLRRVPCAPGAARSTSCFIAAR